MRRTLLVLSFSTAALSAAEPPKEKPFTPGGVYRQGDMQRSRPAVITPPAEGMGPSDAVVLFDGKDLSRFKRQPRGGNADVSEEPKWKVEKGYMEVVPKSGTLDTRDQFGSCQIHIEWATPAEVVGKSQGRGNSGVLLHN